MKKLPLIIGAIALVIILIAAYLGFVPGLSGLLGASTPRDLGIRPTEADYASVSEKLGRTVTIIPEGSNQTLRYEGSHPVDAALTSEEFSAAQQHAKYQYNPLGTDFQAKFHDDGTVEISGKLRKRNIAPWGHVFNFDDEEINTFSDKIGIFQTDPAFYLRGTVVITDNEPQIQIEKAVIGKLPVAGMIPDSTLNEIAADTIGNVPGLEIESLTVANGRMNFKGTYPDSISMVE